MGMAGPGRSSPTRTFLGEVPGDVSLNCRSSRSQAAIVRPRAIVQRAMAMQRAQSMLCSFTGQRHAAPRFPRVGHHTRREYG